MNQPFNLSLPGSILAIFVAIAALLLGYWERIRPKWSREGAIDRLSIKLRRVGLRLIWLESLLLAIGSQIPTTLRQDRILFLTIWAIIAILAILLIVIAMADSMIRLVAHRVRATALQQVMKARRDNSFLADDSLNDNFDEEYE